MKISPRPLKMSQIEAADRLYGRAEQWQLSNKTLAEVREKFPGFSEIAVVVKTIAINALYGTRVLAVLDMASHVKAVIDSPDLRQAGPELVELIAEFHPRGARKARLFHSFASKFAHFFIDPERFPVMDSYATKMVQFHLGRAKYTEASKYPYIRFVENLQRLRARDELGSVENRKLDRYLWLAGEYREFQKEKAKKRKPQINAELQRLFTDPVGANDLNALLGEAH